MAPQQVLALGSGAVGLAGLGVGTAFGVVAVLRHNDARADCPVPAPCTDEAAAARWTDATHAGTISTVAFVVGAAFAVGGAVLWFTVPKRDGGARAAFGVGASGVVFQGTLF
jgi:serine/threonine-protein kinase